MGWQMVYFRACSFFGPPVRLGGGVVRDAEGMEFVDEVGAVGEVAVS
ncbi:hypothetical protein ACWDOR_27350 [Streptosporangium canum]